MADRSTEPVVRLEGVGVSYGDHVACDDVSLRVEPGEIHAVVGASGSGKTTLLRAIAGFERVAEGRVSVAGEIVDDGSRYVPPERRGVGFVFQDYALFPHLSVGANVGYGMAARDPQRVNELLEWVGLPGAAGRRPSQLSGGEQQRVALARALAQQPTLLLLDEPFAHLDANRRDALRAETLALVRHANVAAILVTHDAADALAAADAVHVMNAARLLQSGPPSVVYRAPESLTVARALGPINVIDVRAHGPEFVTTDLGEVTVHGAPNRVGVRPEDLALCTSADGVPATVTERAFLGRELLLTLTSGDTTAHALCRPWDAPEGDTVHVRIRRGVGL